LAFVLGRHCPEQVIGPVTVNDSTRATQHRDVRIMLNFHRWHPTSMLFAGSHMKMNT